MFKFLYLIILVSIFIAMGKTLDANRLTRIYVLKDPRSKEIRYVGKTVKSLNSRLSSHITDCKREKNHRTIWINSLVVLNLKPIIEQIDEAIWINSQDLEIKWIAYYRNLNCKLVNQTDGGEGALGNIKSKESILKLKTSLRLRSKKVHQYSLVGLYIKEYNSACDAADALGLRASNINQNCHGDKKSHGNYVWSYEKLTYNPCNRLPCCYKLNKKVDCFNLNNEFIKTYKSFSEASKELGVFDSNIHKVINGVYPQTGGYIFKLHNNA